MNPFTIHEVQDALSPAQCERVIASFGGRLAPSLVGPGIASSHRTSSSAKLEAGELPADIAAELDSVLTTLTGYPPSHRERWELVRYRVGESFAAHYDVQRGARPVRRAWSVVLGLRLAEAGGEISFPRLRAAYRLPPGTLLAWQNFDPRGGPVPRPEARHESRPVVSGEKWVLVTWVGAEPRKPED